MASQSQRTSASDLEMKRKLNYDATLNSAMASFGGYVADEEAEIAPSSQVKSSKKKRKKNKKEKRRHSQIAAGDNEEEQGTQATLASSPSSRTEKRKSSTPNEDEDEDHIEVTPTPPTKRRRKSSSEKAARRNIDNDGYDATEEETEAEKKRALVNTINRPLTPTQAGDSTGTEHHGETPIRPPPRNHLTNQKHNGTTKVNRKRASRKAKIQHEKIGNGNGITSDADSMRTKLSSSISNDMFARPLARRVAFDSGLAKPMASLAIRGREAVDDEWEETAGKIRGLVHTSGDAEAEENIAYSAQYLEATLNTTITYGNTTRKMLMLSAGTTSDVKAEKGVSLCEVTRGGPLLVIVTRGDGKGGKSFRINEGGLWRVRVGEACYVTNVAGAEVRMTVFGNGNGEGKD